MLLSPLLQVLKVMLIAIELLSFADEFSHMFQGNLVFVHLLLCVFDHLLVFIEDDDRLVKIIPCICIMNLIIRLL